MYKKEAMAAAAKICSQSCACGAGCGPGPRRPAPLHGSSFPCPLRKYNIAGRESPDTPPPRMPVEEDIFYLCADCGNGKVEISHGCETVTAVDEGKCQGCPVDMAWEAIQGSRAEAPIS